MRDGAAYASTRPGVIGLVAGGRSAFDETDVARARAFRRLFRLEVDALTFAQQFEHRVAHGAAMEEVLGPSLVADETEALVDQKTCDCAGRHSPAPPMPLPDLMSGAHS